MEYHICAGLPDTLSGSCLEHNVPKIFLLPDKQPVCQNNGIDHLRVNGLFHL